MKIDVVAVGRMKAGPERKLAQRYAERFTSIARGIGLQGLRIIEVSESPARRDQDRKAEEGQAILALCPPGAKRILLDERGIAMSSTQFAARLAGWRDDGVEAANFIIGGADGLCAELAEGAALVLSFGVMTIPHQLVRILILEQLYRAATLLVGHPYHRP